MRCTRLLAIGLLLFFGVGTTAPACAQALAVTHTETKFLSDGKEIGVEYFALANSHKRPAIILAPDSSGSERASTVYRAIARCLAEKGYFVAIVHFFDRTGHKGIAKDDIKDEDFQQWMAALGDGVQHVRSLAQVEKDKVALMGFSLGAFLSVSVAANEKIPIQAVASYFGGMPNQLLGQVKSLPPTLVVHCAKDEVVSVAQAYSLIGFCQVNQLPLEHEIYQDVGHLFQFPLTQFVQKKFLECLSSKQPFKECQALADAVSQDETLQGAVQTCVGFFKKHLK